ncbi:MAG: hypothetical protein PHW60_07895 [Kiritimatiellae bacterium]|nr:hypothetical protein [Kiritimatiellia bacterium]
MSISKADCLNLNSHVLQNKFPLETEVQRMFKDGPIPVSPPDYPLYLDLAEVIINHAAPWVNDAGVLIDPVEGHDDRWASSTVARFVCPASILVREKKRTDLVPVITRSMDQLCAGVLQRAVSGKDVVWGVLDLVLKEIIVTWDIMRTYVPEDVSEKWRKMLSAVSANVAYSCLNCLAEKGLSLTNYGVSACTGEWIRHVHGLSGDRQWIDRVLALELPLFTPFGMYQDPHDPMLYDLMVRQNLSELLAHGYDGAHKKHLVDLLVRSGWTMLMTLSACDYAPFGGRSNFVLHNEAMLAYNCDFLAGYWSDQGRPDYASVFKEAAYRCGKTTESFISADPVRFIKNWFDPSSRHGKDGAYGEYANYLLLTASLFARIALMPNNNIPPATLPAKSMRYTVNLWPAFHKTFARCGDTSVEIDTRAQKGYDATGLGLLHHKGAPPELVLSMGIPAEPSYVISGAEKGRAAALGPCWKLPSEQWQSLAALNDEIEHVAFTEATISSDNVIWSLEWFFKSGARLPMAIIKQVFTLSNGSLAVDVAYQGVFEETGFEIPCLVASGKAQSEIEVISAETVQVRYQGWRFTAELAGATGCEIEDAIRANRQARYCMARFRIKAPFFRVLLKVVREACQAAPLDNCRQK